MTVAQAKKERSSLSPLKNKRGSPKKIQVFRRKPNPMKKVKCYNSVKSESQKQNKATKDNPHDYSKAELKALKQAKELQEKLPPQLPSMIKYMMPSHVTGGFWLSLENKFCVEHMPEQDTTFDLETEKGSDYKAKYLAAKKGLSGGWRGFSIAHNLIHGDVLVFQLVNRTKFKVYIVRLNGSEEVDGALGLLKLDSVMKKESTDSLIKASEVIENQDLELLAKEIPGLNSQGNQMTCENDDFDEIRLSDSLVDFSKVKSSEDFDIITNGLVINSELSKYIRYKYYDLCFSQKSFLHEKLIDGLNCKLAAGVIAETTNIADAIQASKLSTPEASFATWEMTLKAFKTLGMNIDFLLERIEQLMSLAAKSRRHKEATLEKTNAEEEMRILEAKISNLKELTTMLSVEIQQLEQNPENYELIFRERAKAPW